MYHDPSTVLSPKDRVKSVEVIYDVRDQSMGVGRSLSSSGTTKLQWESDGMETRRVARVCRKHVETRLGLSVPDEIRDAVLRAAQGIGQKQQKDLADGYKLMAADRERESWKQEGLDRRADRGDAYMNGVVFIG